MTENSNESGMQAKLFGIVAKIERGTSAVHMVTISFGQSRPVTALCATVPDALMPASELTVGSFVATAGTLSNVPSGCEYLVDSLEVLSREAYCRHFRETYEEEPAL